MHQLTPPQNAKEFAQEYERNKTLHSKRTRKVFAVFKRKRKASRAKPGGMSPRDRPSTAVGFSGAFLRRKLAA